MKPPHNFYSANARFFVVKDHNTVKHINFHCLTAQKLEVEKNKFTPGRHSGTAMQGGTPSRCTRSTPYSKCVMVGTGEDPGP